MNAVEVLRAAMALIEDERHWCQGTEARDSSGHPVSPQSSSAERWCAEGALDRTGANFAVCREARSLLDAVRSRWICCINDDDGHAAVMECYREAIRRAEAQGREARADT